MPPADFAEPVMDSLEVENDLTDARRLVQLSLEEVIHRMIQSELDRARDDLASRVEDWKGYDINNWGELRQFGAFDIIRGREDIVQEYQPYLFKNIMVFAKNPKVPRGKRKLGLSRYSRAAETNITEPPPKLELKGRIFTKDICDVVTLSFYTMQVWWRDNPSVNKKHNIPPHFIENSYEEDIEDEEEVVESPYTRPTMI
ncbi:hypothetical protein F5Y16DRAFT_424755 [Xylariaceae sp. FL0255]|nr:hypothetical protein F5Y16DRAFT_424755 [Xylariaceae sp. FL0255]